MSILQLVGIILSVIVLVVVLRMIRKRKLQNEYSAIWFFVAVLMLIASIFIDTIIQLLAMIKGDANEVTLLYFTMLFVLFFLILISVKLSTQKAQIIELSQEVGLLGERVESGCDRVKEKIRNKKR